MNCEIAVYKIKVGLLTLDINYFSVDKIIFVIEN